MTLVIIDAENVRSRWPNVSVRSWLHGRASAVREGHEPRIVFDGEPHEHAPDLVG